MSCCHPTDELDPSHPTYELTPSLPNEEPVPSHSWQAPSENADAAPTLSACERLVALIRCYVPGLGYTQPGAEPEEGQ